MEDGLSSLSISDKGRMMKGITRTNLVWKGESRKVGRTILPHRFRKLGT